MKNALLWSPYSLVPLTSLTIQHQTQGKNHIGEEMHISWSVAKIVIDLSKHLTKRDCFISGKTPDCTKHSRAKDWMSLDAEEYNYYAQLDISINH